MVGAAYAAVPFYNWFCRATGFNGTTQVATAAPGRHARPQGHRAVRRQCRPRPAVALRARAELDRGQARRGRDRQLPRHQRGGAPDHGVGGLQRRAAQRRRLFPEDQLLLLHRADASRPGEKRDMPVVFYVDPAMAKDPDGDDDQHHHAVLHVLSATRAVAAGGGRHAAPGSRRRNSETNGDRNGRRARQAAPRLPPGRSEPVAGGRLGLGLRDGGRRDHLDAPHVRGGAAGVRRRRDRRALHHAELVARRHQARRRRGLPHPRGADFAPLRHDPVHRLRGDVLRRLVLGLFRRRAVSRRRASGRCAAN